MARPKSFQPGRGIAARLRNQGYLAALFDRGSIDIERVQFSIGMSREGAQETFQFINNHFGVEGVIRPVNLAGSPSLQRRKLIGEEPNTKTVYYFVVAKPKDLLKLAKAALPASDRPERLRDLIQACREILRRGA
jgi:hypothetical protein